jgi:hypothetical protein
MNCGGVYCGGAQAGVQPSTPLGPLLRSDSERVGLRPSDAPTRAPRLACQTVAWFVKWHYQQPNTSLTSPLSG